MTKYSVTINGLEAILTITPGHETTNARGILFDEDANIIASVDDRRFIGYCHAEIVYSLGGGLMATRRQIEHDDIQNAVEAQGLECHCEEEEEDFHANN